MKRKLIVTPLNRVQSLLVVRELKYDLSIRKVTFELGKL